MGEIIKLNILGQEYDLLFMTEEEFPKLEKANANGLAELYNKQLIISKDGATPDDRTYDNLKEYTNKVIRHEIVHAYFHESGLRDYCEDETLVDWLALQLPKIIKTLEQFKSKEEEFYKE